MLPCRLRFLLMDQSTTAALAAFAGALLALALYHVLAVGPAMRRFAATAKAHDDLLGAGSEGATSRLSSLEQATNGQAELGKRVEQRVSELERVARIDVSRVGFIRYNAFSDTGSELSYALALLNRDGDGVVLSSIFSREDTRTFGKAVKGFRPMQDASKEELGAIAQARGDKE